VSGRDFLGAVALVGARLRGDEEGERALTGGCDCECRPLIAGLVLVAETAVRIVADHDKMTPGGAADFLDQRLRELPGGIR
jgi:hypothetical protein